LNAKEPEKYLLEESNDYQIFKKAFGKNKGTGFARCSSCRAITGEDSKAELKSVRQPENENVITPIFVQEKPIESGRHLRLWKPGEEV
jgi:hypothetical protein